MHPATLWDVGLALLVGVLFGLSPHTSATRPVAKIVGGVAAGVLVLVLRWRAARRSQAPPRDASAGRSHGVVPPLLWAALALVALLFLPTAAELYRHYTEDIWTNGHGFFVPLVVAALAFDILRRDPSPDAESSAWGYAPVVAGLTLLVLDSAVGTLRMSIVGLLLLFVGLSLLVLGPRRTRALAFPLFLILFLTPLPTSLAMPLGLTEATAAGAASVLRGLGHPVIRADTVLELPDRLFGISAHCSGFSTFYAAVGVALVLGYCGRSRLRLVVLLLAAWPLVAVANVLRTVAVVVVLGARSTSFEDTPLHGLSGIGAFWLVMAVLFLLADRRGLREMWT